MSTDRSLEDKLPEEYNEISQTLAKRRFNSQQCG